MMPVYDALYRWVLDAVDATDEKQLDPGMSNVTRKNHPRCRASAKARASGSSSASSRSAARQDRSRSCGRSWSASSLDQRATLPACAQLLHVAARPRGAAARHHRLADASHLGGVVAGGLFVLPGALIMMALAWAISPSARRVSCKRCSGASNQRSSRWCCSRCIASRASRSTMPVWWVLAVAAFVAVSFLKIGFRGSLPWPQSSAGSRVNCARSGSVADTATKQDKKHPPAVIDDDTPSPEHARFSAAFARADAVSPSPWRGGLCGVTRQSARRHGGIFTSAALITFGGAYAVLPYVTQAAVESISGSPRHR